VLQLVHQVFHPRFEPCGDALFHLLHHFFIG
jgi:hypothetical protein